MKRFHRKSTAPKVLKRIRERHAKKRALSRYGLELSSDDLKRIVRMIQSGKGVPLGRKSHTRSNWQVELNGQTLVVGYHRGKKQVLTCLPLERGANDEDQDREFDEFRGGSGGDERAAEREESGRA